MSRFTNKHFASLFLALIASSSVLCWPIDNSYHQGIDTFILYNFVYSFVYFIRLECGRNAVWTPHGTDCPPNCANGGITGSCIKMFVPSCQCVKGFVFREGKSGDCIELDKCPKRAKKMPSMLFPGAIPVNGSAKLAVE